MAYRIKNHSPLKCHDELSDKVNFNNKSLFAHHIIPNLGQIAPVALTNPNNIRVTNASNAIIIVLESPHIDEFDGNGDPIGPLIHSRNRLYSGFSSQLKKNNIVLSGSYVLYLVNAIQSQCSMGITPINQLIKEINFVDDWCDKGEKDFIARMNSIISNHSNGNVLIFNCCTKGIYSPLKSLVEDAIISISNNNSNVVNHFQLNHPSSW